MDKREPFKYRGLGTIAYTHIRHLRIYTCNYYIHIRYSIWYTCKTYVGL